MAKYNISINDYLDDLTFEQLQVMQKKVKQHNSWVSVSECLPENKSVVLCYGEPYSYDKASKPNSKIFCAVYVAEHKRWSVGYSAFGDTSSLEIKFWQPLPQPPSEVQNG